jgi:hypothetical protein
MKGTGVLHFVVIVPGRRPPAGRESWNILVKRAFGRLPERFTGEWTYVLVQAEDCSPGAPVHLQCVRVGNRISADEREGADSYLDDGTVLAEEVHKLLKHACGKIPVVPHKIQEKLS